MSIMYLREAYQVLLLHNSVETSVNTERTILSVCTKQRGIQSDLLGTVHSKGSLTDHNTCYHTKAHNTDTKLLKAMLLHRSAKACVGQQH